MTRHRLLMNSQTIRTHALWALATTAAFAAGQYLSNTPASEKAAVVAAASTTAEKNQATPWRSESRAESVSSTVAAGSTTQNAIGDIRNASEALSVEAMRSTIAALMRETDPIKRNRMFAELLEKLSAENVQVAMDGLREGGLDASNFRDMALLSAAWGRLDPQGAMAYAETIDGRGKAFFSASMLSGWASKAPDAAMAWFREQNAEGFEKNVLARGMIEGLLQNDQQTANRLAIEEPDADIKRQFLDALGKQRLKTSGVEGARAWVEDLLASGQIGADALAGPARDVAGQWARTDPASATAWAMKLPEGDARYDALDESISSWSRSAPAAVAEYLAKSEPSPTKDRAIQDFTRAIAEKDPKTAITWAATIEEPERRERTLVRAAREWHQSDPEAALEWAATSGLSEKAQESIKEAPERGRGRGGRAWGMGTMR